MKNLFKVIATLLVTTTALSYLTACSDKTETYTYVSLKVNPEIELIIDDDGEVVSVNAVNEDGEIVISESEFEGKTIEEACEEFTSISTELGYIDVESDENTVYVHVDAESEEEAQETTEEITEEINRSFENRGIFGKVQPQDLEELTALAEEWGVSLKDAKLINRILELYPEMTAEEVIALSIEDKLELIKGDKENNGITCDMREEYKKAVEALKEEYSNIPVLEQEIKDLELSLNEEGLTEERINEIKLEIENKKAELKTLKEEFKTKLEQIKETYRANVPAKNEEYRNRANDRKNAHREKNENHRNNFERNRDQIIRDIQNWRK